MLVIHIDFICMNMHTYDYWPNRKQLTTVLTKKNCMTNTMRREMKEGENQRVRQRQQIITIEMKERDRNAESERKRSRPTDRPNTPNDGINR